MVIEEGANTRTGLEIAVIGMAGRFPGAQNIHEFWDNLRKGVESISFFSDQELEEAEVNKELLKNPHYIKAKGYLENKEIFDASFFGYTPTEAELMDPQIRIFHECVFQALEDAGYNPESYDGKIGLYAGGSNSFYWQAISYLTREKEEYSVFASTQLTDKDFLCSRVAYSLNLKGASSHIQTACSTSLVAVHHACRALLTAESEIVLAGGISITSTFKHGYWYQEGMILSKDGHCRAFDAKASGTVGGEGVGIVVLKRLKPALEDSDHIYAIIKGTAINNDGKRKVGFTAPSIEAQAEVIRTAQRIARVAPETITYIEAHGTGTALGDPVEIEALKLAFNTESRNYCGIGSVKTNIGHLDAAAGIVGFIKTVLSLKHKLIPPSLHFEEPNPKIDFKNSPFYVNTKPKKWESNGFALRAGVSSFGIGGTNAHVILEEAPKQEEPSIGRQSKILLFSAKTETALGRLTHNFAEYLEKNPYINLTDAAYTLQVGRKSFQHRKMLVCSDAKEAIKALLLPNHIKVKSFFTNEVGRPILFMFPGLGTQYVNMALEFYQQESLFHLEMNRCFEIIRKLTGYEVEHIIYPNQSPETSQSKQTVDTGEIKRFDVAQLAIFCIEYALSKLIITWGIKPDAMIGYSFGEYVAACVSGVFTLEDALKLIVLRGQLIKKTKPGGMLSVPLSKEKLKSLLSCNLSLAIDNDSSCVVAGEEEAIKDFEEQMKKRGFLCTRLQTVNAIHSHMMEPILNEFKKILKQITFSKPQIPYISNVTGKFVTFSEIASPDYWAKHLRETVQFSTGLKELAKQKSAIFIEVGPGRDLSALIMRYIDNNPDQKVLNTIRHSQKNTSDISFLLDKIGKLWLWGGSIDWERFYFHEKKRRIPLPTYPFEGQRYWIKADPFNMEELLGAKAKMKKTPDIADWFYFPSWKSTMLNHQKRKFLSTQYCWLVFMNHLNLGQRLLKHLREKQKNIIVVTIGEDFIWKDNKHYIINPRESSHYGALFNGLKNHGEIIDKIIHLWNITEENEFNLDAKIFDAAQYLGFFSLLYIAKAIGKSGFKDNLHMVILSNHIQKIIGDESLHPEKSMVLGLLNVISQEYPGIHCNSVDIFLPEPGSPKEDLLIDALLNEFTFNSMMNDPIIAYRNNQRWIQTFEPFHLEKPEENNLKLRKDGLFLITGGLGKIGLILAEILIKHGNARLILTGRSTFPPRNEWDQWLDTHNDSENVCIKIRKILELEEMGGTIQYYQADSGDRQQIQKVVTYVEETFGRINGVIHAAGIIEGQSIRTIQELSYNDCISQFQAKIYGTIILAELFKNKELDFFWMISSISSVLGGLGFGAYAAVNRFLDAFAKKHNHVGSFPCRLLSLNWEGMDVHSSATVFERIFSLDNIEQLVVSRGGNLQERIDKWVTLQTVKAHDDSHAAVTTKSSLTNYQRPNLSTEYVEPQTSVEKTIFNIWQQLLGFNKIGIQDDFFELGGDSLKAISIVAKIHKELSVSVPLAEFFNRQTIAGIAEYVVNNKKTEFFSMDIAEEKEYYALSPGQKRLFILKQMDLEGTSYNLPEFLVIEMELVFEKFEEAFRKLIKRHEMLRTAFQLVDEEPVQKIYKEINFEIEFYEPGFESEEDPTSRAILEKITKEFVRTFDLARPPLFRMGIVKLGGNRFLLMKDMHHIISDAVTHVIFIKDLLALYRETPLPELNFQYKDFSEWQQKSRNENNGVLRKQEEYWLQAFPGEIPILNIPSDYTRPLVQSFDGRNFTFEINEEETQKLRKIALQEGVTLYILIFTTFNILLSKISGQEDIIIGTPVVGRRHVDFQQIIGLFINILVLRNYPIGEVKFRDFLGTVKKKTLDAFENQEYPFEELVEKVQVNRDVSRNPLFDVMFLLQNLEVNELKSDEPMQVSAFNYENRVSKFDLSLLVIEGREKLLMTFEYSVKLFEEETIKKFTGYLRHLLKGITDGFDQRLFEIEIINDSEKLRLLEEINAPQVDYPYVEGMHRLFEMKVDSSPDNTVLIYGQEHLTGKCLNERSNMLAGFLVGKRVTPGDVVGVVVERSLEMVVGIVGLLKAGAIYLPIDIELPPDRKKYMIQDSGTKIILSKQQIPAIPGDTLEIVYLEREESFSNVKENLYIGSQAESPAYIIYTSGSTGKSKGVVVHHRSILNTLMWRMGCYKFDRDDVVLQIPSISFDSSVEDIFTPLSSGSKIVLIKQAERLNLEYLGTLIRKERITHFLISPALYNVFLEKIPHDLANLKTVTVAGESFTMKLVEEHFKKQQTVRLFNEYGPTENSVCATVYEFHRDNTKILIGKPINNVACYILDKYKKLLPMGIIGEMCISGKSLAAGYLNNQELTSSKFIANPYKKKHFLYCTGDLARRLPDGNIEFLGRIDFQIKIRGFRVELGEIESRLLNYPGVKEAVVTAQEDESDKYLSAYIVTNKENEISGIREFLLNDLPEYMIPSYFVYLDKIPLNSSGKVDRKALPKPEVKAGQHYMAPRNETEAKLVGLWAEILGRDALHASRLQTSIGIDDNFFQLGGHSLKATILVSRINKELNVVIPLAEVFKNPTIRGFAEYISGMAKDIYQQIKPAEKKEYYILSFAQQRIYILQQVDLNSIAYNIPQIISLPEEIDISKLEESFKKLIMRHESLRTSFHMIDDQPVQRIHDNLEFKIERLEDKGQGIGVQIRAFDLSKAPLLRVGFLKTGDGKQYLLVDMHHIISDGISNIILIDDFTALYEGKGLPTLRIQYKDFAQWQDGQKENLKHQEEYWLKEFDGELPVLELPTDYPRPMMQSFEGNELTFEISVEETRGLTAIALQSGATPFMVLAAAVNILLSKLSGQEEIIIGSPIAGRRHADLEKIIGMFVNTLAIKNYPIGERTFGDFLAEVKERMLKIFENQEYPFEALVDNLSLKRDMGRNPLFDVMFSLQNMNSPTASQDESPQVETEVPVQSGFSKEYENIIQTAKFDLTFTAVEKGQEILFSIQYCTKLFKKETIERFIGYFKKIVSIAVKEPGIKINHIEIISEEEKRQVLNVFNDTGSECPKEKTIHQLFKEQAERTPDNIAAAAPANGKNYEFLQQITYRKLDEISDHHSYQLREKGVYPENIIGMTAKRSILMIVEILGILKSGCAYMPIDQEFPQERIDFMIKDSGATLVLSQEFSLSQPHLITPTAFTPLNHSHLLAYIMYTSGSTGRPKGVMIEHQNVIRLIKNTNYIKFNNGDKILQTGALSFDASTFEIWGSLLNGLQLLLVPKDRVLNPDILKKNLRKFDISTIWMTSPLFNQMVDADVDIFTGLKNLIVGGDVLSTFHINQVRKKNTVLNIINGYGPTENTTFSTTHPIENLFDEKIPIGKPINNSTAYIMDKFGNLQPIAIAGEIWVGGCGVARGYLNNPELTAEKFIHSSCLGTPVEKRAIALYRTGDLARWLPDGNIEFLGRIDQQVKVRGFRIELGEIESWLLKYPLIKDGVVLIQEVTPGDKSLCAYIVSDREYEIVKLRQFLLKGLPDYMIPSYFVRLEKIPLTPNGKIDRKALPKPELKAEEGYASPRNEIEKKLVGLWAELLNIQPGIISIDRSFFELGGHSLKATVLASRIHKEFNVILPLAELFKTPTISGLSKYISGKAENIYESIMPVEEKEYYSLSFAQQRMYILQQIDLSSTAYNMPQIIPLPEEIDITKLEDSFNKLIKRHDSLRTSFHMIGDEPVQKVHGEEDVAFEIEKYAESTVDQFVRAFNLSKAPLLRVGEFKSSEGGNYLFVDKHHIISDGISNRVLREDFMALYEGKELPPLRIQYKDFAQWQNSPKEIERLDQQMQYWLKEFEGEIPVLEIPLDYPRPITQSFAGNSIDFEISVEETRALNDMALKFGATPFMVLSAVVNILLSKLSGQEEIIIGSPIAGRRHADLEKIIGMFVNTLAIKNYPIGQRTFGDFLAEVKERMLKVFENQEYPFEALVDNLSLKRDMGRNPLFDVMFVFQNMNSVSTNQDDNSPSETKQSVQTDLPKEYVNIGQTAKFDLTFTAAEIEQKIVFSIQYCTKLFKKETLERFITYFKKIVSAIVNEPGIKLQHIDIVAEKEKEQLLFDFNKTTEIYSKEKMIYRLIEEQVERIPGNIALTGPSVRGENIQLSYRELNRKSNQLAYILRAKGIISNSVVGVMIRRSIEMIVGLLGVLKSGGAYMPIDPLYPSERKQRMLKDSAAKLLLAEGNSEIGNIGLCELIDMKNKDLFRGNPGNPGIENLDNDLIYTIFTSGSTGYPKGSGVYHRGFLNLLNWFVKEFDLNSKDSVLVLTSLSFDLTQKNIYAPLLVGGRLYIPGVDYFEPSALLREVWQDKITWINCTPGMFYKMVEVEEDRYLLSGLRYVFLGGEPISMKMLVGWLESSECNAEIVNTYGPTECSDVCTYYRLRDWESSRENVIPIGKPVNNTQLYILDRYFQVMPIGVAGELFIAGAGVSAGYINHSEMTWEKFIKISLPGSTFVECYHTGDLARWMANGNIEFLGRIDFQLKIRGFRVEISEIENRLLNYPSIKRAVVLSREDDNEDKYLCAYIVSDKEYKVAELREYLLKGLPDYMIPSYFVPLEKIPLTPNGKVDRRSLPQPELKTEQDYVAPRDRTETKLVELWADVLNIQPNVISINRSFFELGGHSLKATVLASRIHKEFNVILPLSELFKTPTISGLSEYISGKVENIYESIMPVEEKEYYVLSFAQQRMYILQQIDLNSTAYNMPQIIPLHEAFDIVHLEETFKKLIMRHDSLRTSFHMIGDEPVQKVHGEEDIAFEIEKYEESNVDQFVRAFNLSRAPLLRVGKFKSSEGRNYLFVDKHHIISDGISNDILGDDFMALYKEIELPPLRIQYKDFAQWQNSPKEIERLDQQMQYWLKEFEGEIPVLEIPLDYPRPLSQSFAGNSIDFEILVEETRGLTAIALESGATPFMVLTAAVNILLSKLSGQEEIIIGSPIAGRRHADLEKVIGMFVNTLAIKNYPVGQRTFGDFLAEVKERMLKIFENQEYPFEVLVDKLALKRDMGRNPLFDVMFVFQNMNSVSPNQDDNSPSETKQSVQTDLPNEYVNIGQTAKFDLTFSAVEAGQKILLSIQYCTKLFKKETIERFIAYLKKIVSAIVNEPGIKLQHIDIISNEEKKWMLDDFNNTEALYPKNKTIHQLFEEQVKRAPDRIALVGADGEMKKRRREEEKNGNVETLRAMSLQIQMSYHQLKEQSDHLAGLLIEKGVLPDDIVGIMMERSSEMIIGILGILKSGGAYMPIDPGYPQERINYMLKDSGVKLLAVANDQEGEKVGRWEGEKVLLESIIYDSNHPKGCPPRALYHSSHLAYVIYTSGSTGRPKGVMINHSGLVNYICWSVKRYVKDENVNFPLYTSPSFDLTITSVFTPLVSGRVIFVYEGNKGDILIDRIIDENNIEVCKLTPSHLKLIQGKKFENSNIKRFIVGGEELETQLALDVFSNLNGNIEIYNEYGPTETVVGCMEYKFNPEERDKYSVPIGVPIDNVRIYILDNYMNPVPVLVLGEICIGGDCIARGYLNRPIITAEKFVRNPFIPGQKIYKTGDLGRRLPNGNIEFISRLDNQVKIRGFRIELGEIENQILIHKSVKEVVIIARSDQTDFQSQFTLCAYIVPNSDFDLLQLQEYLLEKLPDYMIPSYFVLIDKIPLTQNGKVDRKALPRPEFKAGQDYVAPRNSMEVKLVQLWADVLNVQPEIISINQNFFNLGGHSLKASVLAYRIHKELDVILPLGELFKAPTIKDIGKYIENSKSTVYYKNIDWNLVLIKEGLPGDNHLFFIHDGSGEIDGYIDFCGHLTNKFNYWGIRMDKVNSYAPQNLTIEKLAYEYVKKIKKVQRHGPYYICGWSLGGTIAVEIVKQLEHEDQAVPFLALIDVTSPPGDLQKNEIEFTTQTETGWMQIYLGHEDKIKQILTKKASIEDLWADVVNYLAGSPIYNTPESIKTLIPLHMVRVIPHFHQLSIKQLIQYFNRIRSLENARNRYMPGKKLASPVHFFAADRSPVLAGSRWSDHFNQPLKIYKIKGDHFSLFQKPEVINFASRFDQVLQEVKP